MVIVMRIVMVGTGYVGLVSGAYFADFDHQVSCVDKDRAKIDALHDGSIPFFEPGLEAIVESNVAANRLKFTLDQAGVLPEADAVFIAVGTPSRRGGDRADLCEKVGADVSDVARGIGSDTLIGSRFLHAGPGYGGSCFLKDTLALLKTGYDFEAPLRIVESVVSANDLRKRAMGHKVVHAMGCDCHGETLALLSLSFKANTDAMRDSSSIAIVRSLQDAGMKVHTYGPEGMGQAKKVIDGVTYCLDSYHAMEGADAGVIVTEWDAFRALDLGRINPLLNRLLLVDLRNLYNRSEVEELGFEYVTVGRKFGERTVHAGTHAKISYKAM